ncbi:hypothetical protein AcW1_001072 [Taiwanofungus camphoratus]|nr:hypothetical protein AcW2_000420 [Antrodia cinnamomea]KAI0936973.1 hypothetical protein AcV5_004985 [Antrodia cinnamomea]KAI0962197.1 hypothetical protein AcV7_001093 [Antrodia cinnamomea]KAI0964197.1 hypothetical protein AcW1_001072 [Antrodia cinnamomea]
MLDLYHTVSIQLAMGRRGTAQAYQTCSQLGERGKDAIALMHLHHMDQKLNNKPAPGTSSSQSFRTAPVQQRSIWESWAVLPPKTRLRISLGVTAVALAGILISDQLEKVVPTPTKDATPVAEGAAKDVPPY